MTQFLKVGDVKCIDISILNKGVEIENNIEVTVTLPSGVSYNSSTPSIGTYTSGTGVWDITQLIVSQSATLEICVDVDDDSLLEGDITWEITAVDGTDPDLTNNSNLETIGVFTCDDIFPCMAQSGSYDNATSGLTADSYQDAIDELVATEHVKVGVAAALSSSAATTVTTAGTYYPIEGTFTNIPIEQFVLESVAYGPVIKYIGTETLYFEIDAHAALSGDANGITAKAGIKKNNTIVTDSIMSQYLKTSGELFNMSGTSVVQLATNDDIQMVTTADTNGDVLTYENLTATIRRFF